MLFNETIAASLDAGRKYSYAFLDELSKREIRRKLLKAVAIPGYQVPFASRELPIGRGWGTGGLQITLSLVGPDDVLKVIDQGSDAAVNAMNIRRLVEGTTGIPVTSDTRAATIIQTRHRIPEEPLQPHQILVLQVPTPEPLRLVEPSEANTRRMHAEQDYGRMWVHIYEDIVRWGDISISSRYPVRVHGRYIMDPSPIPRWDIPKLDQSGTLHLFGAGKEKRLYAIPPYTSVKPLEFADFAFRVENFSGLRCQRCGSETTYLTLVYDDRTRNRVYICSDTDYCRRRQESATATGREGGA